MVYLKPQIWNSIFICVVLAVSAGLLSYAYSSPPERDMSKEDAVIMVLNDKVVFRIRFDGTVVGIPQWNDVCEVIKKTADTQQRRDRAISELFLKTSVAFTLAMAENAGHPCKGYVPKAHTAELNQFGVSEGIELDARTNNTDH